MDGIGALAATATGSSCSCRGLSDPQLQDVLLAGVLAHLPATALAHLRATCSSMCQLLDSDASNPFWASAVATLLPKAGSTDTQLQAQSSQALLRSQGALGQMLARPGRLQSWLPPHGVPLDAKIAWSSYSRWVSITLSDRHKPPDVQVLDTLTGHTATPWEFGRFPVVLRWAVSPPWLVVETSRCVMDISLGLLCYDAALGRCWSRQEDPFPGQNHQDRTLIPATGDIIAWVHGYNCIDFLQLPSLEFHLRLGNLACVRSSQPFGTISPDSAWLAVFGDTRGTRNITVYACCNEHPAMRMPVDETQVLMRWAPSRVSKLLLASHHMVSQITLAASVLLLDVPSLRSIPLPSSLSTADLLDDWQLTERIF